MKSPISPVFSASLWIILEKGTVKDRRKTVAVRWGKAHQRVLRCLKVTNICENGEKSSKQITCCNDQKSTVARKAKSPAFQRGLMNLVPDSESKNASIMLILVYFVWFGEICTLFCTRSPFWYRKGIKLGVRLRAQKESAWLLYR